MRRTASEVLRSLEMRVARLERQSAVPDLLDLVKKDIPFKTVRDGNQLKFVVKQVGVEFTVDTSPKGAPKDVVYIQAVGNQYTKDGQYNSALEAVMRSGLFGMNTGWSGDNGKLIATKYFQIRDLNKGAREIVDTLKRATKKLSAESQPTTRTASADKDMAQDIVLTLNEDEQYWTRNKGVLRMIKEDMDSKMFDKRKALQYCKDVLVNFVPKYERSLGVKVDRQTLDLASEILCKDNIAYVEKFGYSL